MSCCECCYKHLAIIIINFIVTIFLFVNIEYKLSYSFFLHKFKLLKYIFQKVESIVTILLCFSGPSSSHPSNSVLILGILLLILSLSGITGNIFLCRKYREFSQITYISLLLFIMHKSIFYKKNYLLFWSGRVKCIRYRRFQM